MLEIQMILSKYELAYFCELAVKDFQNQIANLKNPEPGMLSIPEWYCDFCQKQEINDMRGISHLEKHIEKLEGILQNTKYTNYFDKARVRKINKNSKVFMKNT